MACPPVRELIKLVDNLLVQADKPWYNYYMITKHGSSEKQTETIKSDQDTEGQFMYMLFLHFTDTPRFNDCQVMYIIHLEILAGTSYFYRSIFFYICEFSCFVFY